PTPIPFTFPRMILGWFMEVRLDRGQDAIRIPESGLAARTFRGEWASELDSSAALDGAGAIGDSIGTTITQCLTTAGTILRAGRFITGMPTPEVEARAESTGSAAEPTPVGTLGTDHPTQVWVRAAELPTVPAQRPGLSRGIARRHGDTLHPKVKEA